MRGGRCAQAAVWDNANAFSLARDASLGDSQLLKQALNQCKVTLQDSVGLVTTGFDAGDEHPFSLAQSIELLAGDLVEAMVNKRRKRKKRAQEADADA